MCAGIKHEKVHIEWQQYDLVPQGRTYIEGRPETEYTIRVKNNNPYRVLAVPSIDGINPLTGEPAVEEGPGYIVPALGKTEIEGWRTSLKDVAAFLFSKKEESYAAKGETKNSDQCGVIGLVIFREKEEVKPVVHHHHHTKIIREREYIPPHTYPSWPWYPNQPTYWMQTSTSTGTSSVDGGSNNGMYSSSLSFDGVGDVKCAFQNNMSMSADQGTQGESKLLSSGMCHSQAKDNLEADAEAFNLGTAWGASKSSIVNEVNFDRGARMEELSIYYASRGSLKTLGVDVEKRSSVNIPQAFGAKFCKPPR